MLGVMVHERHMQTRDWNLVESFDPLHGMSHQNCPITPGTGASSNRPIDETYVRTFFRFEMRHPKMSARKPADENTQKLSKM